MLSIHQFQLFWHISLLEALTLARYLERTRQAKPKKKGLFG
jgi:hypothetical protein